MDISRVSTSTPVSPLATGAPKPDQPKSDATGNDSTYQPTPPPPLPPGQGVRVDQLA